jgi:site-specific DNA recombinase
MKQAAMYVRVSTQQQKEGATIESQKALLLQHAKEKGFEICPEWIFEDNGVSGAKLARPALDKLRDFASEGIFGHIFIMSPDRLSRKYAYQAILMEEFRTNGIELHFQNSNNPTTPQDYLMLQMQGVFAEYERAQITERSRRGKIHKAKNGCVSVLSRASFGYRYIKGMEGVQAFLEINEHEAAVVRTIFDLYVKQRCSIKQISHQLLERQIKSPTGQFAWTPSTLFNLLKNSAYRGVVYFGKRENCEPIHTRLQKRSVRVEGRRTPRRGVKRRDAEDCIPIPVPAIIDNETFEMAQELMQTNKRLSLRNAKPGALLQGLITCQECGYSFGFKISGPKSKGYCYYKCIGVNKKCTNQRGIRMEVLDEMIWESIISLLKSPKLIQNEVSRRLTDAEKAPALDRKKMLQTKLTQLATDSNRLLDAYQSGCIELADLRVRMNKIKCEKNKRTREMAEMDCGLSKKQLLEISEAISYFSSQVKDSEKHLDMENKRKILRMLVQEIKVGLDGITIDHILPIGKSFLEPIARVQSGCERCIKNDSIF